MSRDRKACYIHQKILFKNNNSNTTKGLVNNNKITHANNTFSKWSLHETKKVYSKRLSVTYYSSITSRSNPGLLHSNFSSPITMYYKTLNNFELDLSPFEKTKRKQQLRFQRLQNRLFDTNKELPIPDTDLKEQLSICYMYHTLIYPDTTIHKNIQHLKYEQNTIPYDNQYPFTTPFLTFSQTTKDSITNFLIDKLSQMR